MGCSILCMFAQLRLFRRTTPHFKNNIYATVHSLPLKRSLHSKHFSRKAPLSVFFSSPKPLYLFWKVCISRSLLMEERISDTSLTHRFPFTSLPFLRQQHSGRQGIMARAAAKPFAGGGGGGVAWGEGAEPSLPGRHLL